MHGLGGALQSALAPMPPARATAIEERYFRDLVFDSLGFIAPARRCFVFFSQSACVGMYIHVATHKYIITNRSAHRRATTSSLNLECFKIYLCVCVCARSVNWLVTTHVGIVSKYMLNMYINNHGYIFVLPYASIQVYIL